MSKVDRKCKNCGSIFSARQADVNRGWAKFCSKSCKAKEQERRTGQNAKYQARKEWHNNIENIGHERETIEDEYPDMSWDAHKSY